MRHVTFAPALALLATVAACADGGQGPTAPTASSPTSAVVLANEVTGGVQLKRPRIDVTNWIDDTERLLGTLDLPAGSTGIGTGSAILITIPNEGRFGCTANFIWRQGTQLYLGAAGHCFLPAALKSTHGAGADYDASGVVVQVCVEGCEGNFRSSRLLGKFVTIGRVAYARQTDPTATEDIGNDFGIVEIPAALAHLARTAMPVWGSYSGAEYLDFGKFGCHYGNGLVAGETVLTKARVGIGGGGDQDFWMGDFAGAPGDSGSGLISCESDGLGFKGVAAVGVLTHLGIGDGEVKIKGTKSKVEHGAIFGTTVRRSIEMAREAGLSIALVDRL